MFIVCSWDFFPISRDEIFSRLFFLTLITMPRMIARVSAREKNTITVRPAHASKNHHLKTSSISQEWMVELERQIKEIRMLFVYMFTPWVEKILGFSTVIVRSKALKLDTRVNLCGTMVCVTNTESISNIYRGMILGSRATSNILRCSTM